jgi:hypothetical protein
MNPMVIDQDFTGVSLIWGDPTLTTFVKRSRFHSCDVTITCSARGIIISDCIFSDCTIRVKRSFANYQFFRVGFDGCRFVGKFPGCEFGFREAFNDGSVIGFVRHCDFTAATLDLVGLNGTELSTVRMPPWPHFVAKSEAAFATISEFASDPQWSALAKLKWPAETTAVVVTYRTKAPRGFAIPEAEARAILERAPGFVVISPNAG